MNPDLLFETYQRPFHLARASERAAGMIRLIRRRAPERHDGIADVFVQRPLVTEDHLDLQAEIAVEQIDDLRRRFAFGEGGESLDVGKQHRDLALLTGQRRVGFTFFDEFFHHARIEKA
jgi:hypothetical protein